MYRYDEFDERLVRERVAQFASQVERRLAGAPVRGDQQLTGGQAQDRSRQGELLAQRQGQDRDFLIRGNGMSEDRATHLVEAVRGQAQLFDDLGRASQVH